MSADLKETSAPLAEISNGPSAFEAFLDRNQKGLFLFAVLLAIAAGGAVVYRGVKQSNEESAGAELSKASDIAAYQAVVDQHANTVAGGSALILLADSQWAADKKDDSISTLQKFISTRADHPALASARANLGAKFMALGKSGDATKLFNEIVADPEAGYIAPFALISLGDLAKSNGDAKKAEEYYMKVLSEYPDSTFTETAKDRNSSLNAKPPVEIDAPPAPEAGAAPATPPGMSVPTEPSAPIRPEPTAPSERVPTEPTSPEPAAPGSSEPPLELPVAPQP